MAFINENDEDQEIWINAKTNLAMDLAIEEAKKRKEKTLEEIIPEELADYKDVFDKKAANRFPESKPYDHAIELKEDFIPKDCKVYPLSLSEQEKLDEFVDENLEKRYIRHRNPLWRHHSSLSKRKMENYDLAKTIGG